MLLFLSGGGKVTLNFLSKLVSFSNYMQGVFSKLAAVLVSIPQAVLGGMTTFLFTVSFETCVTSCTNNVILRRSSFQECESPRQCHSHGGVSHPPTYFSILSIDTNRINRSFHFDGSVGPWVSSGSCSRACRGVAFILGIG